MIPGLPLIADDTLDPFTFVEYFRALTQALKTLEEAGKPLVRVYIWRGRLIVRSTSEAFDYRVLPRPCPFCRCKDFDDEDEESPS